MFGLPRLRLWLLLSNRFNNFYVLDDDAVCFPHGIGSLQGVYIVLRNEGLTNVGCICLFVGTKSKQDRIVGLSVFKMR